MVQHYRRQTSFFTNLFKLYAVSDDNENNGDQTEITVAKQSITTLLKEGCAILLQIFKFTTG
jgi:hypothetical protein